MGIDYPLANTMMEYNYKINNILKYVDATKKDGKFDLNKIKKCTNEKCKKEMPEHAYIDKFNRIVNQCLVCRLHAQVKSKRQTRINSKALWKEKNPDKCAKYWLDSRGRQIANKGINKYLEDNAKTMKAWRDKNPEKCLDSNEAKKSNIKIHYTNYVRDADKKNIKFELTQEEFNELVKSVCYYCGTMQDKGLNGIDKKDYTKGYTNENSVSCCEICNVMKGTLSADIFLKRIEHILTYQGYIEGTLYPEYFANHSTSSFKKYKNRANIKLNKEFELSEDQFYKLIFGDCYICGKKTDDKHTNGIDRIDNEKGYIINNVESCCGECNYMKNKFNLDIFFDKLRKIKKYKIKEYEIKKSKFRYQNKIDQQKHYEQNKLLYDTEELKAIYKEKEKIKKKKYRENIKNNNEKNYNNVNIHDINNAKISHLNKKTPEQIKEESALRKQKQREKLKEKYGNEEYKKKRALEIAEYRKIKKTNQLVKTM
jgi:hypothetical protein